MQFAAFITHFGNSTVLVPLSLVVAVWLLSRESPRMALLWLLAVVGVTGVTAVAKMLLSGCQVDFWDIRSPSGHASFSMIAYGGLAVVVGAGLEPAWRRGLVAVAVAAALAIGVSRVALGAHTSAEVVAGLSLGGVGLAAFTWGYEGHRAPRPLRLAAALIGLVLLAQGPVDHVTLEPLLERLGFWVVRQVPICEVDA